MSEESEILAAEYVLGTLHADERTVFVSVLAHDQAARDSVAAWENHLSPLCGVVPEIAPPPAVWERIESALPGPPLPLLTVMEGGRDEAAATAALRRSLGRWRALALGAGALAASLAIFVAGREAQRGPLTPLSYVAVVNRGGDQPALIVRVDLASGSVFIRPVAAEAPSGKSLELWYIGAGKAPKSMGLVAKDPIKMPLPTGASLEKASFAVTVEPEGGSPTGDPTGPIVYSGQLIKE
ncbi:anti-sigma factor [Methylocapsa aurea]|uniref:anti-sigma factor n=1 Tax=Methylocapsa aurea TaxID=663610 RepID=UPI00055E5577|nr:anti-sigma factor [Methylocapsa aurea]